MIITLLLDPPNVSLSSEYLIVNQSDVASFNCTIFSIPLSTVRWFFNGTIITTDIVELAFLNELGLLVQISELTISNSIRNLHEGTYSCNATNGVSNFIGSTESDIIMLVVQGKLSFHYIFIL